jgi:hypothetical protein
MPEHLHYHDEDIVNVETHHEKSDVDVKALLTFFVIFVIFSAVTYGVLLVFFHQLKKFEDSKQAPPLTAIPMPDDANMPQNPRLQPFPTKVQNTELPPNANTPVTDMVEMREAQEKELHSYGWIDKSKGIAHIPIEEAKKLVLQRGMPAVTAPPPPPSPAPSTPAGSSSP